MAKIKKEEEEKSSRYDFILPLTEHDLRSMWGEFTNGKQLINFRGKNGKLSPAEYVYYNKHKIMTYNEEYQDWAMFKPEDESFEDFEYRAERAKRHWKQFEAYARKRQYALTQSSNVPVGTTTPLLETEVKLNGFWEPNN